MENLENEEEKENDSQKLKFDKNKILSSIEIGSIINSNKKEENKSLSKTPKMNSSRKDIVSNKQKTPNIPTSKIKSKKNIENESLKKNDNNINTHNQNTSVENSNFNINTIEKINK